MKDEGTGSRAFRADRSACHRENVEGRELRPPNTPEFDNDKKREIKRQKEKEAHLGVLGRRRIGHNQAQMIAGGFQRAQISPCGQAKVRDKMHALKN